MLINYKIAKIRKEYSSNTLEESSLSKDPFEQFQTWWQELINANIEEPNAMALSTVYKNRVSSRTVLLKSFDKNGFLFFTNYQSPKAQNIEKNFNSSLLFFWKELQRQVRIEGSVSKISTKLSTEYFQSRPISSQLSAIASPQSEIIPNRLFLEKKIENLKKKYESKQNIPRPTNWGGYKLLPTYFEFWQGRESRLHDRMVYKNIKSKWTLFRLAP